MSANTNDRINPGYYKDGDIECIDAIAAAVKGLKGMDAFCTGCAMQYLWRWKKKNKVEDLKKATWYINWLISANSKEDK